MTSSSAPHPANSGSERLWWWGLVAATAVNCVFQIAWFWRFHARNITMDGIDYIGLARHLVDGNWRASLHGYWSPLTSWIIAGASVFGSNFTLLGHLVTLGSCLLCLPLLYWLTWRLWRSRVAAALAMFWFSTARGIAAEAVGSIIADFVLTACVLLYFILLLEALRRNTSAAWLVMGAAHGLAFLAKAIAMPWLAISTLLAVLLRNARAPRRILAVLLLAFLLPAAVWAGWGLTLRAKYGVFTTGYQLRANLQTNWTRRLAHRARGDDAAFGDTSSLYDEYMVGETSWSGLQAFRLRNPALLRMIFDSELQNLPQAVKEMLILLTPGGVLGLLFILWLLFNRSSRDSSQALFAGIALVSAIAVIGAYCMLVFDGRYVIPVVTILIAIGSPALVPSGWAGDAPRVAGWVQKLALALFVASTIFFSLYWASPFRTVDRDFEASCYPAAEILRNAKPHGTLVSIGDGPYPEHGLGFEAAPYLAYFAGWRLVAGNSQLPAAEGVEELVGKALGVKSDAVAIWGSPRNPAYEQIVEQIRDASPGSSATRMTDPKKGEVGTLILRKSPN